MTREIEIIAIKNRIARLKNSEKNLKCPGVLRKCMRKLRKLEGENE